MIASVAVVSVICSVTAASLFISAVNGFVNQFMDDNLSYYEEKSIKNNSLVHFLLSILLGSLAGIMMNII